MRRILTLILGALLGAGTVIAQSSAPGNVPGFDPMQGVGLSISIRPGTVFCGGSFTKYSGGSFTLQNNTTTYFYLDTTNACLVSFKYTTFAATDIPIATVVTQSGYIAGFYDQRPRFWSVPGGGGTGGSMAWPTTPGIMVYGGGSAYGTSLAAPSSGLVGLTDAQTLTNKTIDGVTPSVFSYLDVNSSIQSQFNGKQSVITVTTNNTSGPATFDGHTLNIPQYAISGGMSWPASPGLMVYGGSSSYGASLAAPSSALVGVSDTQSLTNKTLDGVAPTTMGYIDATSSIQTQLDNRVLNSLTINGHALSANVTLTAADIGLSAYATLAGSTFTGKVNTLASAIGGSGFNLPHGVAPTSPVNGDVWTTSSGLYVRINGSTVGPLGSGGAGSGTVASGGSYSLSAYGSSVSTQVNPSNIATDSTGNNLVVPGYLALGPTPPLAVIGSATGIWGCGESSITATPTATQDSLRCDSSHLFKVSLNGASEFVSLMNYSTASNLAFSGYITTATPTTSSAGLNLPPGVAPTTPINGDVWTTSSGLYVRVSGTTVGPLGTGTGGGGGGGGSPAYVQSAGASGAFATNPSTTITMPTNISAGNVVTVWAASLGTITSWNTPTGCSLTFSPQGTPTTTSGQAQGIWTATAGTTQTCVITISASSASGTSLIGAAIEASNVTTTGAVISSYGQTVFCSSCTGQALTVPSANSMVFTFVGYGAAVTFSSPSPYTFDVNATNGVGAEQSAGHYLKTTTGTYTPTFSASGAATYTNVSIAFPSSGGGGGGSGSGTVNNSSTQYALGYYSVTGTVIGPDTLLLDNQTVLAYTGTGGVTAPSFGATGSSNGYVNLAGTGVTAPTPGSGIIQITAPNSVTAYSIQLPATHPTTGNTRLDCSAAAASVCTWAAVSGGSMVYPALGLALSTGSAWASSLAYAATTGLLYDTAGSLGFSSTLPTTAEPAHTGDAQNSAGSLAMTVKGINGVALSGLATGLLKNTTATGVPTIAVAGTDYVTPSGNISGSAASFTGSLAGDVTGTQGATVVGKINGVLLSGLATGLLKNTTATGVPSIAAAGTDYVAPTTTVNGHALSANVTVTAADVSLGSVTNAAQTLASVVPNTAPTSSQILVGNAGGTAYAPQTMGGDGTLSSTGQLSVTKSGGVSFGTGAFATIASYAALSGATFTGKITTAVPTTAGAMLNLPHGAAPTTPTNGDVWTTTAGLYVRINGTTVGPLGTGGGGSGTVNNSTTQYALSYYSTTGTAVSPDTLLLDNGTILAYTGTGGMTAPSVGTTGSTNGYLNLAGAGSGATSPGTGVIQITVPNSVTAYTRTLAAAAPSASSVGVYSTAGVESWVQLAGAGAAIPTGPTSSVSGDIVTFTGTAGQHADSGTLLSSLAPLASPTFTTPTLGAATATTINKVTITQPTTSATLTLVTGSTLQLTGAFTLNLTATATTTPTFPSGTHTLSGLDVAETLSGVKSFTARPKSTVGFEFTQGSTQTAGTTSIIWQSPTSVTSYVVTQPGTGPANNNMMKTYSALASSVTTQSFVQAPRKSMLTSAYTNATATPSNLFSFSVDASTQYTVHCSGVYKAASSGAFTFGLTGPATPTLVTYKLRLAQSMSTNTPTYSVFVGTGSTYPTGINTTAVGTAATDMDFDIDLGFTNGTTAGTLAITGATLSTNTLTVEAGSYCYAY